MKGMVLKKLYHWLGLGLLFVLACGTPKMKIVSDYDPMVDFSQYKTYAFAPGQKVNIKDKAVHNEFVDSRIRKAVEEQMAAKKFQKATSAYPDVWVDYQAILKKGEKVRKVLSLDMRDLGEANEFRTYTVQYHKGTLILAILNPKTSKPIFKGSAQAKIDMEVDWPVREKRIHRAVKEILKDFPPSH